MTFRVRGLRFRDEDDAYDYFKSRQMAEETDTGDEMKKKFPAEGFHVMPASAYHADPCKAPSLSNSLAKVLLGESPRKAWYSHPRLNPAHQSEESEKFDVGTAAHAVLLENDASRIQVIDAPDWRKAETRAARDAARDAGKTPLLSGQHAEVLAMTRIATTFIEGSNVAAEWKDGDSELTAIWREGPVWLRCRFDRISKDRKAIFDYKTTDNASPEPFSAQIVRMGYHLQEAFYRRAVRKLLKIEPKFYFLAQSAEAPHECSLHACDPSLQEIADAEVERAISIWHDCMKFDRWPTYSNRVHYALPTSWLMSQHEQRVMERAA